MTNATPTQIRPVTYMLKSEHADVLRRVGNALGKSPLRGAKSESILVAVMLMDLADKVDHAFRPHQTTNVVPINRVQSLEAGER